MIRIWKGERCRGVAVEGNRRKRADVGYVELTDWGNDSRGECGRVG